ncbi:type II 3-dehydroquinate dehydratase [Pseudidiomarina sp.]|uniref:type II 3-dehydroquinate dehydratase n=1 Tax=Pseudidiomarina sp. TaxID=2081707 RepID=UPI00299E6378|nr:type II 3-dehydroquinate dehydratase [Pseudidiomarina sp.]MDX1706387.1 type II 3-dehydroquinate dehydratase [Pseudidiomarina sp.]
MTENNAKNSRVLLLNGPNLNLLGTREPDVYGSETLTEIEHRLSEQAKSLGISLECRQSNAEHELIDWIHEARDTGVHFILINPGAYSHTSIALRDALTGVAIPFIEIHLSNIHAREEFRHYSYLSDIATGVICGLGAQGYTFALQAAQRQLTA